MIENNSLKKVQRYRTVKACLVEIKKLDGETAVTEWFIRQLCKKNKIKYFMSGNKILVSLDSLLDYLGFEGAETKTYGGKFF